MLGPIDYIVLGFKGNEFDGAILGELSANVDAGIIRVIDLVFIIKDAEGNVAAGEYDDQPEALKNAVEALGVDADLPLFTESDIDKIATDMENDTAAGVLIIEHVWAKSLKSAIADAGGFLIADGRIHPENVAEALAEIAESK